MEILLLTINIIFIIVFWIKLKEKDQALEAQQIDYFIEAKRLTDLNLSLWRTNVQLNKTLIKLKKKEQ